MINFIKVINRMAIANMVAHDYIPYNSWYLISIYADNGRGEFLKNGIPNRVKELGCKDFLSLNFYDSTDSDYGFSADDTKGMFSKIQAEQVVKFIDCANRGNEDDVLLVHCDAGISRSGAVGEFANDYLGLNYYTFVRTNPQVNANGYVLRLLREQRDKIDRNNSMFNAPT